MLAEDLGGRRRLPLPRSRPGATRAELVERACFAMLGELSAGIAHELNNLVTALVRAAKHLHRSSTRCCGLGHGLAEGSAGVPRSPRRRVYHAGRVPPHRRSSCPSSATASLARRPCARGFRGRMARGARADPGGIDAYEAGRARAVAASVSRG